LQARLSRHGRLDCVGRSFGVIKLTTRPGATYDFSIPRRDSKVASGHRGFIAAFDPSLTLEEASARRDFTINALMFDPRSREIIDCHGGLVDLDARTLRHTSPAFVEDPLRVMRGMQFAGRFDLVATPQTIDLCRSIKSTFAEIAKERVREEWMKWAERAVRPSRGLEFLAATGWIEHFPEIARLRGTPQDPEWHPEGDVFVHTAHCCDAMAKLPVWLEADPSSRIAWMFAILAHDFGKPDTTREETRHGRLRIVSPEHEPLGAELCVPFFERLHMTNEITERVIPLVAHHLAHMQSGSDRAIRRLAHRLQPETIQGLCAVMSADALGRPPRPAIIPESVHELLRRSQELRMQTQGPEPILKGRHLLALGLRPGKKIGLITALAFEAQLEGTFQDLASARAWLAAAELPMLEEKEKELLITRIAEGAVDPESEGPAGVQ
ncbi:MAG: HD domain-containing protein, partial [Verrucomicrobia bacterium]|nr:HD domain-containing protein [Verrucomicrobiota bacterium]